MSNPEEQIIEQIEKKQEIIFNIIKNEKDFSTILNTLGDSGESKKLKQDNDELIDLIQEALDLRTSADVDSLELRNCVYYENPNSQCLPEEFKNFKQQEQNDDEEEDIF